MLVTVHQNDSHGDRSVHIHVLFKDYSAYPGDFPNQSKEEDDPKLPTRITTLSRWPERVRVPLTGPVFRMECRKR